MADRPILFSGPMVQALLAGRKTVTRRVIKPYTGNLGPGCLVVNTFQADEPVGTSVTFKPKVQKGDRLWVREAWSQPNDQVTIYRANWREDALQRGLDNIPADDSGIKWKPGIHMFRRDSRLTLVVTGVKIERLQEIDEAEAIAEGVGREGGFWYVPWIRPHSLTAIGIDQPGERPPAVRVYANLWDHINGAGAWEKNPWVSATTFTVHKRNIEKMGNDDAA